MIRRKLEVRASSRSLHYVINVPSFTIHQDQLLARPPALHNNHPEGRRSLLYKDVGNKKIEQASSDKKRWTLL